MRTPVNPLMLTTALLLVSCGADRRPIEIGLVLSLADSGVAPMLRGAKLAVEQINAAGGVRGRPLSLVVRDDFDDVDSAVRVAGDLYRSNVVAVVGSAYSAPTIAAAPVYSGGRRPVVQISPSASVPDLSNAGDYTFRTCPTDLEYGAALARWAHDRLGLSRAAILYVNDDYGRGFRMNFVREFERLGGAATVVGPFLADQPDVSPYLQRLQAHHDADAVILGANLTEGLPALRQVRAAGLKLPVLAGDGFVGVETRGDVAEGLYVSTAYLVGSRTEANQRFVEAYRRGYPTAPLPDQGAASTYDVIRLLGQAIDAGGPDRTGVRNALAGIGTRTPAFDAAIGRVAFDSLGDVPSLGVRIGVVRHGQLEPAE
jgi:branched-chain amino acid transport system substrate-binding protein